MTTHTTTETAHDLPTFVVSLDDVRRGDILRREDGPVLVRNVRRSPAGLLSLDVMDAGAVSWTMTPARQDVPVLVSRSL